MTTEEILSKHKANEALQATIQATTEQQIAFANIMGWTQMEDMNSGVFEHPDSWDVLYISQDDFDYSNILSGTAPQLIFDFACEVRRNEKYNHVSSELLNLPIGLPIERYVVAINLFLDKLIQNK